VRGVPLRCPYHYTHKKNKFISNISCLQTYYTRRDILNKLKLESVMRLHGDTGTSLAKFLKMSRTTFSAKINETKGAEFTQGEIAKIRSKYNLSPSDVIEIFFEEKVS
jgi:hypothetical protein